MAVNRDANKSACDTVSADGTDVVRLTYVSTVQISNEPSYVIATGHNFAGEIGPSQVSKQQSDKSAYVIIPHYVASRVRLRYRSVAATRQSPNGTSSVYIACGVGRDDLAVIITDQPSNHSISRDIDACMSSLDRPIIVPRQRAGKIAADDGAAFNTEIPDHPSRADHPEQADTLLGGAIDRQISNNVSRSIELPRELLGFVSDRLPARSAVPIRRIRRIDIRGKPIVCRQVVAHGVELIQPRDNKGILRRPVAGHVGSLRLRVDGHWKNIKCQQQNHKP
ncbi:hypothetical protein BGX30_003727 [Mortierella sp. GBA39]|nr:hypothetical protein BGX30_003727 [Mortierella sp. GBA39]